MPKIRLGGSPFAPRPEGASMIICPDGKSRPFMPYGNMYEVDYQIQTSIKDVADLMELNQDTVLPLHPNRLTQQEGNKLIGLDEDGTSLIIHNPLTRESDAVDLAPIFGAQQFADVRLASNGRIAGKPKGSHELLVSHVDPSITSKVRRYRLGEYWGFGFDEAGRLFHLDHRGRIRCEGERFDFPYIGPKGFLDSPRKRPNGPAEITQLQVSGNLLVIEEAWPLKWKKDTTGYRLQQRIIDVGEETPLSLNTIMNSSSNNRNQKSMLTSQILQPNHAAQIEYPLDRATHRPRYPVHAKVSFVTSAGGEPVLGSQRVERSKLAEQAIAISYADMLGFIGKTDGTIEVVDLSAKPDAGEVIEQRPFMHSGIGVSAFSVVEITSTGDPYPECAKPEQIIQWQAHKAGIARVFILADAQGQRQLCSIDEAANVRLWKINFS